MVPPHGTPFHNLLTTSIWDSQQGPKTETRWPLTHSQSRLMKKQRKAGRLNLAESRLSQCWLLTDFVASGLALFHKSNPRWPWPWPRLEEASTSGNKKDVDIIVRGNLMAWYLDATCPPRKLILRNSERVYSYPDKHGKVLDDDGWCHIQRHDLQDPQRREALPYL